MNPLIERYSLAIPRNADGTAGAAGNGVPGGAPVPGTQGGPPAGNPGNAPVKDPPAGSPPQPAPPAPPAPAVPPALTLPEGFPDAMRGRDLQETLENAWKAIKGYRDKDATRQVPQDAAGYLSTEGLADFAIDPSVQPFFDNLKEDKAALAMFEKAREYGLDRRAVLDVWQSGMKHMADSGLLEPLVDTAAERAALLPDTARSLPKAQQDAAIDRRMQENYDFLQLMEQNRGLPKEARAQAEAMLGDSAKGHLFLEWMRGAIQAGGDGPGAHGGIAGAPDTAETLREELARPEMQPGHAKFDKARHEALMKRYRQHYAAD